jgi:nitroreductase
MDTFDAIKNRRSIKSFKNYQMTKDEINQILESAILSPTSYNIQNWRFVIITKQDLKDQLCSLSYGQRQVAEASLVIILCADLKSWAKNPERYWKNIPEEPRNSLVKGITQAYTGNPTLEKDQAIRSCGIAAQTIMLAAQSMGYDSCPMEGFDYGKVGKLIKLPDDHIVTMMVVIGKKAKDAAPRGGQLSLSEVVFENNF